MPGLPIRRVPDPILNKSTHVVARIDGAVVRLIDLMIATMRHHPRCVGLAAPQIGSSLRIAVMDSSANPKAGASRGLLVLVNPVLTLGDENSIQREGCLSIPDFTGSVRRAARVRLKAQDREGAAYEVALEGFEAIVAQHEVDHLDGKLFLDRVTNPATDIFRRKTYL